MTDEKKATTFEDSAAQAERLGYQLTDDGCRFIRKRDSPELEQQPIMTM